MKNVNSLPENGYSVIVTVKDIPETEDRLNISVKSNNWNNVRKDNFESIFQFRYNRWKMIRFNRFQLSDQSL